MKTINVYPTSSVDMMAAAIACELHKNGTVELKSQGLDAIGRVFSSVGLVKECMGTHSVDLVSAKISEQKGSFIIKASKRSALF